MMVATGRNDEVMELYNFANFAPEFVADLPEGWPFEDRQCLNFLVEAFDDAD